MPKVGKVRRADSTIENMHCIRTAPHWRLQQHTSIEYVDGGTIRTEGIKKYNDNSVDRRLRMGVIG